MFNPKVKRIYKSRVHKDKFPVYFTTLERLTIRRLADSAQTSISEWVRLAVMQHPDFISEHQKIKQGTPENVGIFNENSKITPFFGENGRRGGIFTDDDDDESNEN